MAEFNLDKMARKMAEKALDEFICNGKTLREWIEIIVAQDLLAIAELEKIRAEIIACTQQEEGKVPACINYGIKLSTEIVEKHISELKGENNE